MEANLVIRFLGGNWRRTSLKNSKNLAMMGLITLGIVYGDIGTSPLYVMTALINDAGGLKSLTPDYVIGCLSLVFWTLMLMTTIKYVLIALRADNRGEGGIFALYALVKKRRRWLIYPALLGGAALLADGTLTPAVTVTTAIEGLKGIKLGASVPITTQTEVIVITFVILLALFLIQKFGTSFIGKAFGPLMLIWFTFLAVFGLRNLTAEPIVLKAFLPQYGLMLLTSPTNKVGIFILGSVFLATTGAEALYSDMGHVGRRAIYLTWPFVFFSLTANYFGQGAYLIHSLGHYHPVGATFNPFYDMLPHSVYLFGVLIATIAAIIASQALITGSFTLVEEAVGLKLLPKMQVSHPSLSRGQIYIRSVNWALAICTTLVLFYFRTSTHMEAAYGLAITLTMLMTTLLLFNYLQTRIPLWLDLLFAGIYLTIETVFLISSLTKFAHGGYVTVIITILIVAIMVAWYFGNQLRIFLADETAWLSLKDYTQTLSDLTADATIPLYISNLVMLTKVRKDYQVKREALYSILDKTPKRALVYWFVTVNTTDSPYTNYYTVDMLGTRNVVDLQLYLGFKMNHQVSLYLRQVVQNLMKEGVIDPQPQRYTTTPGRRVGDFRFIILQQELAQNTTLRGWQYLLIAARVFIQNHSTTPIQWFGLEFSQVTIEKVPLLMHYRQIPPVNEQAVTHTVPKPTSPSKRG